MASCWAYYNKCKGVGERLQEADAKQAFCVAVGCYAIATIQISGRHNKPNKSQGILASPTRKRHNSELFYNHQQGIPPFMILAYLLPATGLCALVWLLLRYTPLPPKALSYGLFAVAPLLTALGVIAPLTGFAGDNAAPWLYGITFLTPFLALVVYTQGRALTQNTARYFLVSLNPIYLLSGPIPANLKCLWPRSWSMLRRRFAVQQRYAIVGLFFLFVAAPGLHKLLALKASTQALDTLLFGFFFEFYVYFNFAGYSLLAYAAMKTLGLNAPLNFKQPFSATTVVEYWQRWHTSLGNVLRTLFFTSTKRHLGPWVAVWATFMASAAWHGTTFNFMLWGAFQAAMWCVSRWLFLKKAPMVLQYVLLILAVSVGRVLFSEADANALITKLSHLATSWLAGDSQFMSIAQGLGNIDKARLFMAGLFITYEIWAINQGEKHKRYKWPRHPAVSTGLLAVVAIFTGGEFSGAVYGAR